MVVISHILGYPRVGLQRDLKKSLESYWAGKLSQQKLLETGRSLRAQHWQQQKESGLDFVSVGDFAWYDHVLTTSLMLNNIPDRHRNANNAIDLDTLFRIARGRAPTGDPSPASEMTKWFNTNYHYIVPEFKYDQNFSLGWTQLLEEVDEALSLGHNIKPVLLGPVTYLWLGKVKGKAFDRLSLLSKLLPTYKHVLVELARRGIEWVQIDEPALVLDLPESWRSSFKDAYTFFAGTVKLLLTTYFDGISHQIDTIIQLPVNGLHVDLLDGDDDIGALHETLPKDWILSVGIVNGRNVWRADVQLWFEKLHSMMGKRHLWVGSSCSLLHTPIDLEDETLLNEEVRSWLAFAKQKCAELGLLRNALNRTKNDNPELERLRDVAHTTNDGVSGQLRDVAIGTSNGVAQSNSLPDVHNGVNGDDLRALSIYSDPIRARVYSARVNDPEVKARLEKVTVDDCKRRSPYATRAKLQRERFRLPLWPTTTIGSFPQTGEVRNLRLGVKKGHLNEVDYCTSIKKLIQQAITEQEKIGLDVLVHGEAERNDMVEYFSELLKGFVSTQNGWVQSYGSRCVKPPIIVGDISRQGPMTIDWVTYAKSLTSKPVKGMLTGPVTMLCWSFPREDISRSTIASQIALALRDEVADLEKAQVGIIQIDEPALREGLPLKQDAWHAYLKWAVEVFRLSSSVVRDDTQIHSHMCYSEFNDIIESIAAMDADVILIEASRSGMDLLEVFKDFQYPNEIGLGVYDIHSPNVPTAESIYTTLRQAAQYVPSDRLWVNPDCGLKTRTWPQVRESLTNMVNAARKLRMES